MWALGMDGFGEGTAQTVRGVDVVPPFALVLNSIFKPRIA